MSTSIPLNERPTLALKGHIDFCACNVHRGCSQYRIDAEGIRHYGEASIEGAASNLAEQIEAIEVLRERGTWDLLAQALTMPFVVEESLADGGALD